MALPASLSFPLGWDLPFILDVQVNQKADLDKEVVRSVGLALRRRLVIKAQGFTDTFTKGSINCDWDRIVIQGEKPKDVPLDQRGIKSLAAGEGRKIFRGRIKVRDEAAENFRLAPTIRTCNITCEWRISVDLDIKGLRNDVQAYFPVELTLPLDFQGLPAVYTPEPRYFKM